MTQKRDNDYFLERIRREHPQVHADYLAGKFKNVTEARKAAGQIKIRTALDRLGEAWTQATPAERDAFKAMIGCAATAVSHPMTARPAASNTTAVMPTSKGRQHLPPTLATDVRAIMTRRHLTTGVVMREIGRDPMNPSLGNALRQGWQVQSALVADLENWVARHQAP